MGIFTPPINYPLDCKMSYFILKDGEYNINMNRETIYIQKIKLPDIMLKYVKHQL